MARVEIGGSYRLTTAFILGHALRAATGFELEIATSGGTWATDDRPRADVTYPPWPIRDSDMLTSDCLPSMWMWPGTGIGGGTTQLTRIIVVQPRCLLIWRSLREVEMTAAFVLMAVGGVIGGLWFRAAAVAAASVLVLAISIFYSIASGSGFWAAAAISFGLIAVLQAGYLAGLFAKGRRDPPKGSNTFQAEG